MLTKMLRDLVKRMHQGPKAASDNHGVPQNYRCGDIVIKLPPDHFLPVYQKAHKLYDRFLPHLSSCFGEGDWLVDIGANCGDTLAAMVSTNPSSSYLCIEGDDLFFDYLTSNIGTIKKKFPATRIIPMKALVGTNDVSGILVGQGGTKTIRPPSAALSGDTAGPRPQTLDGILASAPETEPLRSSIAAGQAIRLLKSDVDGYDYDVINSAERLLDAQNVVLYFECQYGDRVQLAGYLELVRSLFDRGYDHYWIFDNFGALILHTQQADAIENLIHYVCNQNEGMTTRTIYYFDILACGQTMKPLIKGAISAYQASVGG